MALELLLEVDIAPSKLDDDAVGRVMDGVWEAGIGKMPSLSKIHGEVGSTGKVIAKW
jgi:hypothetical protein